ncbi:MAG: DUF6090 family protein [Bacteroidota bacterium]
MKINWKYALGEIIIVIIGISLAFLLNNWGESLKERKVKQLYLESLKSDIEVEMNHLSENQKAINIKLGQIRQLMPHMGRALPGRDSMGKKLFQIANSISFKPETNTYQTLVNSGDLKLIDKFELRRQIEQHYNQHQEIQNSYKRLEHIHSSYLADFFVYELDYGKLRQGNNDFLDKPLLSNILSSIMGAYMIALDANQSCMNSNERLLKTINSELSS